MTPLNNTRLVEHAPGYIMQPETSFMDEATVTPGLTTVLPPRVVLDHPPGLTTDSDIRAEFPESRVFDVMAGEYEAFLADPPTPVRMIPALPNVAL